VLRYQNDLAATVNASKAAGADVSAASNLLKSVSEGAAKLAKAIAELDKGLEHHPKGELIDHARYSRDVIIPAMNAVREAADELETMVADDLWPLPTYREMLFIK
jgi:glutamine synthetase